jgi:hypothetical protein
MRLWTRIGIMVGLVVLISLASVGVYSLTGDAGDGSRWSGIKLIKQFFAQ